MIWLNLFLRLSMTLAFVTSGFRWRGLITSGKNYICITLEMTSGIPMRHGLNKVFLGATWKSGIVFTLMRPLVITFQGVFVYVLCLVFLLSAIVIVLQPLDYLLGGVRYQLLIFFSYSEPVIELFIGRFDALWEYLHCLQPLLPSLFFMLRLF